MGFTKGSIEFESGTPRLRFGEFVLDLRRAELTRAGKAVALRPKTLALLIQLVARAGEAVPKEELLAAVWPGVVVTDDSLNQCVAELRAALGDRGGQSIIRTLPRLGYRFEAAVVAEHADAPPPPVAEGSVSAGTGLESESRAVIAQAVSRDSSGNSPLRAPRRQASSRFLVGAVTAAALTLGAAAALDPSWRKGPQAPPGRIDAELMARRSIAVLPFDDRSVPPAPHFAEGVVQDILTNLARMRDTLVIAGGTSRALAARGWTDPQQVGRELGVQHVLTGSVQREGERALVLVQLVRAASGAVLWSERFEYAGPAAWNWSRDVAERVAGRLDVKLQLAALEPAWHEGRTGQAMDHWMRGEYLLRRYKSRGELQRAREHFEAALAIEPRSVNALLGLARAAHTEVLRRFPLADDKREALALAKDRVLAALAVQPNHPGALATLGVIQSFAGEFEQAEQTLTKALALDPNNADAHRDLAGLKYFTGRFDEVQPHIEAALRLNPLEPGHVWQCHMILGDSLMHLGQERAREHHRRAALAEPTLPNPYFSMAGHAAMQGRIEEAREFMAQARKMNPWWSVSRSALAERSNHPLYQAARARYREGLRAAGLPDGPPDGSPLPSPDGRPDPSGPLPPKAVARKTADPG